MGDRSVHDVRSWWGHRQRPRIEVAGRRWPAQPPDGVVSVRPLVDVEVEVGMPSWSPVRSAAVGVLVLGLVTAVGPRPVAAQSPPPVPDGSYLASFGAAGVLTGSDGPLTIIWRSRIRGAGDVEVAGGQIRGDLGYTAITRMDFRHPDMDTRVDLTTVADVDLDGSGTRALMSGQETTRGVGSGMGAAVPIGPNTFPVPPFEVVLDQVACDVAVGDWTYVLEELAAEEGLSGELDGWFVLHHLGEAVDSDLRERIDDLFDRAYAFEDRVLAEESFTEADLVAAWSLVNEAIELQAEADATDPCVFEGDAFYADWFTGFVAAMVAYLLELEELSADFLEQVVDLLLAVGAIGAGADARTSDVLLPLLADQLDRAFREVVIEDGRLNDQGEPCTVTTPCVLPGDRAELLAALRAASKLGLEVTLGGERFTPQEVLASLEEAA